MHRCRRPGRAPSAAHRSPAALRRCSMHRARSRRASCASNPRTQGVPGALPPYLPWAPALGGGQRRSLQEERAHERGHRPASHRFIHERGRRFGPRPCPRTEPGLPAGRGSPPASTPSHEAVPTETRWPGGVLRCTRSITCSASISVHAGQQHRELVAADLRQEIGLAEARRSTRRRSPAEAGRPPRGLRRR